MSYFDPFSVRPVPSAEFEGVYGPNGTTPLDAASTFTFTTALPAEERTAAALERIAYVAERFANGWLGRLLGMGQ